MNFDSDNFILSSVDSSLENFQDFLDFDFFSSSSDFENNKGKESNTSSSVEKTLLPKRNEIMAIAQENTSLLKSVNPFYYHQTLTMFSIVREGPIKLATKSKKIRKRRRTKGGVKLRRDLENILLNAPKKYLPADIGDPNLDDKTKRQLVQKVKNRIASKNTRDQRRNYITELEEVKIHLTKANEELNERNRLLEERLKALENEKKVLIFENQELRKNKNTVDIEQVESYITYEASPVLSRCSSKSHNNYKYFLGTFMVFAVFSGVKIKLRHVFIVQREIIESPRADNEVWVDPTDERGLVVPIRDSCPRDDEGYEEEEEEDEGEETFRDHEEYDENEEGEEEPEMEETDEECECSMGEEEKLKIPEDDHLNRGVISMVMRLFLFIFCWKKRKENLNKEKRENRNKALQLRLGQKKSYHSSSFNKAINHKRFLVK